MMVQRAEKGMILVPVLRKRKDFLRVAATRKKWNAPGMIVQICPQPQILGENSDDTTDRIRVGYTVSKKVGNSAQRSRVKRRLREVARIELLKQGQDGYDYVVIGRKETLNRSFDDLLKDLRWCLRRLKDGPKKPAKGKDQKPLKNKDHKKPNNKAHKNNE